MNKIILLSLCIFVFVSLAFSQEAKTEPVSAKMIKSIKQNLPDWTISQNPKLANEGMRNNPTFEFKLEDKLKRKVNVTVSVVDEKEKESYFELYFRRSIMPRDSNTIENFVDKGFMIGTGNDVNARFSKNNLMVDVDLRFISERKNFKIPAYELFAPSEEKQKLLKIVEVLAKSIESEVILRDCQNTFFKYASTPGENSADKLFSASAIGDTAELTEILKQNANANARLTKNTDFASLSYRESNTALHFAAKQGCVETVKALVSANADINAVNSRGETPLMLAAYHSNVEAARFLISANADIQAESFGRNAAFLTLWATHHISVHDGRYAGRIQKITEATRTILKELSAKGLDLKKKDSRDGNTLLTEILSNSGGDFTFETAQFLLASGVDPNEANNNGETPLLINASRLGTNGIEIMNLLISQGADVNKRDKNGQTALTVLMKKQIEYKSDANYFETANKAIQLLKNSGAKE